MSEMANHPLSSSHPSGSGDRQPNRSPPDRIGSVKRPIGELMPGELLIDPPSMPAPAALTNSRPAMNRATPGAMMLMAKPDTMWLTPNVAVARACSRPPRMPPMTPPRIAIHGPPCQPHQPAKIVPMIIMPSRPMFTVPLRSANRPPRPARAIGAAVRTITPNVPADVRFGLSAISRAAEMTSTTVSTPSHVIVVFDSPARVRRRDEPVIRRDERHVVAAPVSAMAVSAIGTSGVRPAAALASAASAQRLTTS